MLSASYVFVPLAGWGAWCTAELAGMLCDLRPLRDVKKGQIEARAHFGVEGYLFARERQKGRGREGEKEGKKGSAKNT